MSEAPSGSGDSHPLLPELWKVGQFAAALAGLALALCGDPVNAPLVGALGGLLGIITPGRRARAARFIKQVAEAGNGRGADAVQKLALQLQAAGPSDPVVELFLEYLEAVIRDEEGEKGDYYANLFIWSRTGEPRPPSTQVSAFFRLLKQLGIRDIRIIRFIHGLFLAQPGEQFGDKIQIYVEQHLKKESDLRTRTGADFQHWIYTGSFLLSRGLLESRSSPQLGTDSPVYLKPELVQFMTACFGGEALG
ncbi:MAG: hypothetical protein HY608_10330 [Planctomycetes bacterium]|nr:hypothetical protein [Planctomycetota bacterium]